MYDKKNRTLLVFICFIYAIITIFAIFVIGLTRVDALQERSNNDASGFINNWTTINVDDQITNYNVVYNTTNRTWEQFKDTAMVGTNKYNLDFTLYVRYYHNSSNEITGNLYLTLYNGSNLVAFGQKCSKSVTKNEFVLFTLYKYDVSCVGFSGAGYYPYINVQVQAKNAQTGTRVESKITKWNYYVSSASVDTDSINSNSNKNTQIITENNNENTDKITNKMDDINDTLNDSNVDNNVGNSFFSNFVDTDHGGISGIITSPLVAINSMLSGTCNDLSGTWRGKTFTLPCGTSFWSNLTEIRSLLNITLGGLVCYGIIRKLYLKIHALKNPDDDRVEVMSL